MFKGKEYAELREGLRIDPLRLGEELMEHPARIQTVIEFAADALQCRDAAKTLLNVVIADATKRVRDKTEEKLSDPKAASLVLLEQDVGNAAQELEDAQHDLLYWQGLADSYREKGSALKRIAELTVAGYLAPNAAYETRREELRGKRRPMPKREE